MQDPRVIPFNNSCCFFKAGTLAAQLCSLRQMGRLRGRWHRPRLCLPFLATFPLTSAAGSMLDLQPLAPASGAGLSIVISVSALSKGTVGGGQRAAMVLFKPPPVWPSGQQSLSQAGRARSLYQT